MNGEDRGGNGVINMSVSVLSGNLNQFYPKIGGHMLIPNFGESRNYQWACFGEGGAVG